MRREDANILRAIFEADAVTAKATYSDAGSATPGWGSGGKKAPAKTPEKEPAARATGKGERAAENTPAKTPEKEPAARATGKGERAAENTRRSAERSVETDIRFDRLVAALPALKDVFVTQIYPAMMYAYAQSVNPTGQTNRNFIFDGFYKTMNRGKLMHVSGVDDTSRIYSQVALPKLTALFAQTTVAMLQFYVDSVVFSYASEEYGGEATNESYVVSRKLSYLETVGDVIKAGIMAPLNLFSAPLRIAKLNSMLNPSDYVPLDEKAWRARSPRDPLYRDKAKAAKMWNVMAKHVFPRVSYKSGVLDAGEMASIGVDAESLVEKAFAGQDGARRGDEARHSLAKALDQSVTKKGSQFRNHVFRVAGTVNKMARKRMSIASLVPDIVRDAVSPDVREYYDLLTTNMSGSRGFDSEFDEPLEFDRRGRVRESRGVSDAAWDAMQQLQLRNQNKSIEQLKREMRQKGFSATMAKKAAKAAEKKE